MKTPNVVFVSSLKGYLMLCSVVPTINNGPIMTLCKMSVMIEAYAFDLVEGLSQPELGPQ